MNAVVLAAGKGTRLGEITKDIPKPMIKINGKPILEHNILLCKKYGITDIYINLHYLPHIIKNYFNDGKQYGINIHYYYEENILGTAGAIEAFYHFINKYPFYVIYGDNYTQIDLKVLFQFHNKNKSDFTIAMHYRDDISQSGVLEYSDTFRITNFVEKPKIQTINSKWVNAGVYLIEPSILKGMMKEGMDFGMDVIPHLIDISANVYGFKINSSIIAIDTPELYKYYNNQ